MKKLALTLASLPLTAIAHESATRNDFVHALEHHLNNPLFSIVLVAGAITAALIMKKLVARK